MESAMRPLVLAAAGLLLAGATTAQAADSTTCVRRNDVRDWSSPRPKELILQNYERRMVLIRMHGNCSGFGTYDTFAIKSPMQLPASCVVPGDTIVTRWDGEPGLCTIDSVQPYTGALPPKHTRSGPD